MAPAVGCFCQLVACVRHRGPPWKVAKSYFGTMKAHGTRMKCVAGDGRDAGASRVRVQTPAATLSGCV